MAWLLKISTIVAVVICSRVMGSPVQSVTEDLLQDPNFRPKPEVIPNKTIDQVITDAYGDLSAYMSDNFLDPDGEIVTELDLVLIPEQFKAMYFKGGDGRYKRKATRPLVYRWTDKTIPYEFVNSHFDANELYYIKKAMERWEETTCLKFRPYTSRDRNRIRFQNGNGCNSLLGMAGGVQPINLQKPGCRFSGLYLHEIGHAIGLVHEHQLPDRDQYIYIIYDNVAPSMRIWFNKYSTKDVNQYGVPFEYSSVMHYGITAFSKDGYSQTIRARDRSREKEIGRVYLKGLSFSDIKVVNLMYDCNKHCAADPNCKDPAYLNKDCVCVRPDGGVTPTTKPTTGSCSNIWDDAECQGWANRNECNLNPLWMRENCKKSCNACEDETRTTTPDPKKCTNPHGDAQCEAWARRNECNLNREWMIEFCQKACNACSGTGTGTGTTDRFCKDENHYCPKWAEAGYCTTNWYTEKYCKKSCNTCGVREETPDADSQEGDSSDAATTTFSALIVAPVICNIVRNYL